MPGMNGYEFIKKVKEMQPNIKVFFMTAFELDDMEFNRILPSIKIDEFIEKPVSLKNLVELIAKYVYKKQETQNFER